jgi:hypothetical protein
MAMLLKTVRKSARSQLSDMKDTTPTRPRQRDEANRVGCSCLFKSHIPRATDTWDITARVREPAKLLSTSEEPAKLTSYSGTHRALRGMDSNTLKHSRPDAQMPTRTFSVPNHTSDIGMGFRGRGIDYGAINMPNQRELRMMVCAHCGHFRRSVHFFRI